MAASSGAVRAGGAFVELFAQDNKLYRSLDAAEARVRKFGAGMAKAGAAIGLAGASVAGPMGIAKKFAIDDGAAVDGMAKSLGTTAEELTAFTAAAGKSGVSADQLSGYLSGLPDALSQMADGGGASSEMLRRLGIDFRQLINLPFGDRMALLSEAVSRVTNPIDQARVATELFGDAGRDLLPLLKQGGVAYKALADEAIRTGNVMTSDQAAKAADAQRALTSAYEAARTAVVEIGMAMIPTTEIITKYRDMFLDGATAVRAFIRENKAVIAIVGSVATGLVAVGTALAVLGGFVAGAGVAISAFVSLIGVVFVAVKAVFLAAVAVIGGAIAAILSPVGLVVAAVVGLGLALYHFADVGKETMSAVKDAVLGFLSPVIEYFKAVYTTFMDAWGGIVTAVKAGDLESAWAIASTAIMLEWARAMVSFSQGWNSFKGVFVDGAHEMLVQAELAWNDIKAAFLTIMGKMIDKFDELWAKSDGVGDFMVNVFKEAGNAIADYLGTCWDRACEAGKKAFLDMTSSWTNVLKAIGFIAFPGGAAALALIEKSKEQIQETLDKAGAKGAEAVAKFEKFRDEKAAQLGAAIGKGAPAIEADRAAKAKEIRDKAAADLEARKAARAGDVDAAKSALEDAEKAFAKALGDAAAAEEERNKGEWESSVGDGKAGAKADPPKPGGELPSMSKGTFTSTSYGQLFSSTSVASRQLVEAEKANGKLDEIIVAVKDSGKEGAKFK